MNIQKHPYYKPLSLLLTAASVSFLTACSSTSDKAAQTNEPENDTQYEIVNMKKDAQSENLSADKSANYATEKTDSDVDVGNDSNDSSNNTYTGVDQNQQYQQNYQSVERPVAMTVTFEFDSSKLSSAGESKLNEFEPKQGTTYSVQIDGYTDSTGPESYNQNLSEERAKAVASYLKDKLTDSDIDTSWDVEGHGEQNPTSSNETEWGRTQNRRVRISISPEQTENPETVSYR